VDFPGLGWHGASHTHSPIQGEWGSCVKRFVTVAEVTCAILWADWYAFFPIGMPCGHPQHSPLGGWGGKDVYGGRKSNLHCSAGMLLCMFPDWDGWGGGLFLGLKRKGMGQEGWIFALVPGCTFPSWPVLGLAVFPGRGEQGRGQEGLGWNVSASLWCSFVVMLLGWQ